MAKGPVRDEPWCDLCLLRRANGARLRCWGCELTAKLLICSVSKKNKLKTGSILCKCVLQVPQSSSDENVFQSKEFGLVWPCYLTIVNFHVKQNSLFATQSMILYPLVLVDAHQVRILRHKLLNFQQRLAWLVFLVTLTLFDTTKSSPDGLIAILIVWCLTKS